MNTFPQIKIQRPVKVADKQKIDIKNLSPEKFNLATETLMQIYHCCDYLTDLMDELFEIQVLTRENRLIFKDTQIATETILSYFANEANKKGGDMERIDNQIEFERFFRSLSKMTTDQRKRVFNFQKKINK